MICEEMLQSWKEFQIKEEKQLLMPNKVVNTCALATKVLVVAIWRVEGWATYCDAVPGINHDKECQKVAVDGVKLHEHVARALFPQYEKIPYIR